MSQVKEFKPLKLWITGETKPLEYKSAIDALKELNAIQKGNKNLSFMDVKYVPKDVKGDKVTGEVREYPAKLLFRIATPRDTE